MCPYYTLTLLPVLPTDSMKIGYHTCPGLGKCVSTVFYAAKILQDDLCVVCVHMLSVRPGCCSQLTSVIYWRPQSWCCPSPWHITSITRWCTTWSEGNLSSNSTSSTTCWRYDSDWNIRVFHEFVRLKCEVWLFARWSWNQFHFMIMHLFFAEEWNVTGKKARLKSKKKDWLIKKWENVLQK